jgi:hypothetical protein
MMLRRYINTYGLMIIAVICVFCLPSVLAKEKQGAKKPSSQQNTVHSDFKANKTKIKPIPVMIDPRNPDAAISGSLEVDIILASPTQDPWIEYSLSATLCRWMVRKPGDYGAQSVIGTIKSNVDVIIDFIEFGNLRTRPRIGAPYWMYQYPDQQVDMFYSANIGELPIDQVQWHKALDFNNPENDLFIQSDPVNETYWHLWSKVSVTEEISSANFEDNAFISFKIANLKTWIDPEIGD